MKWSELKEKGVIVLAGAVSGGLDSCTTTHWLTEKGFSVRCFTVDLGQPDEENLDTVCARMIGCGAVKAQVISGQNDLANAGLKILQAQARYEGGYWNTTGIARPITVRAVLKEARIDDIPVLFHGCTGRGNDQVRFQVAANIIDPSVDIYAPWRDPEFVSEFPGRRQMIDYSISHNLPIKDVGEAKYSTDANFLGLTHEAGDLEDVEKPFDFVEPVMGDWPWEAPDQYEIVTVRWQEGLPVALNGEKLSLVELIKNANLVAGKHGVGIGTHVVENRYVGVKSRGIYEAPGMEMLGRSYEYLLQFILDRRARLFYEHVSSVISQQVYQGYWLDLATTSALAALDPITKLVTGTISVRLCKGNVYFEAVEDTSEAMPHSIYTDDSSMESAGSYSHVDAEGFVKVMGVSAKNVGRKQFPQLGR